MSAATSNSTTSGGLPLATTSPSSPYLSTPSASAVLLPLLALITIMLDTPCFVWHLSSRNAAASMLVGWIMLENLIVFVNGLLWPTDDVAHWWHGQGYCDVAVKLDFAAGYAIGASTLCIMRALASALNTRHQELAASHASRRRSAILLYSLTVGLPIYSVVAAFIVQPQRYYLLSISGCAMAERNTAVTVVLCYAPLVALMVATAAYAVLVLVRLHRYRRDLAAVLASSESGLSRSRFMRLLGLALVVLAVYCPLFLYIIYGSTVANTMYPFVWSEIHDPTVWNVIVLVQSFGQARVERWVRPTLGLVVFACFGFGRDIKATYTKCFRSVGLGRVVEYLHLDEDGDGEGNGNGAAARRRRAKQQQQQNRSSSSSTSSGFKGRARRVLSKLSISSSSASRSSYSRKTDSMGSGSGVGNSPNKTVFIVDEKRVSPSLSPASARLQQQQTLNTPRATGLLEQALYDTDSPANLSVNNIISTEKEVVNVNEPDSSNIQEVITSPLPTYQQVTASSSSSSEKHASSSGAGNSVGRELPAPVNVPRGGDSRPSFSSRFWARLSTYVQCMPVQQRPAPLGGGAGGSAGLGLGMGLLGYGYGVGAPGGSRYGTGAGAGSAGVGYTGYAGTGHGAGGRGGAGTGAIGVQQTEHVEMQTRDYGDGRDFAVMNDREYERYVTGKLV